MNSLNNKVGALPCLRFRHVEYYAANCVLVHLFLRQVGSLTCSHMGWIDHRPTSAPLVSTKGSN
jgi:hypothetical protein